MQFLKISENRQASFRDKFAKKMQFFPVLLIHNGSLCKTVYNGAEGTVLENVTLKFESFDNFASFFWFWSKKSPGGVPTSQGGAR